MKYLFFFLINQTLAYSGVVCAMIFGWGLWPDSWLWMILGYSAAAIAWPFSVWAGKRWAKSFFEDRKDA